MSVFATFPVLETERLHLRRITADDVEAWRAVFARPVVTRYLVDFDETTDQVEDIIRWTDSIFEQKTGFRWAITRRPDDTMIGSCGFQIYSPRNRRAEVGYELHDAHWRQGIMYEAMRAVLDFGFERLNLHRVEADVTDGNVASAALLRKLGFRQEGTWRDRVYGRGKFHDLWQFGLLEDEYNR